MKVSVIVPVYNAEKSIVLCLEALLQQNYSDYEIIVVDNGSDDTTCDIVGRYESVRLLFQNEIQSSYAARNIGIANATGELLAFTDADCIPESDWLCRGVHNFEEMGCDMLGGRVNFIYSQRPTGAEIYDSLVNMQNHKCIPERGVAKTANFFAKKAVFEKVGMFPEVISGGDVMFTADAVRKNFSLVYGDDVVVRHPARCFRELLKKSWRTGTGSNDIRKAQKKPTLTFLIIDCFVKGLVPPNPFMLNKEIASLPVPSGLRMFLAAFFAGYFIRVISRFAAIVYFFVENRL